jgi:hypothetical protein
MKLFPYLAEKTNLSLPELEVFYDIKTLEIATYDESNQTHEVKFKFYLVIFRIYYRYWLVDFLDRS